MLSPEQFQQVMAAVMTAANRAQQAAQAAQESVHANAAVGPAAAAQGTTLLRDDVTHRLKHTSIAPLSTCLSKTTNPQWPHRY